MKKIRLKVKIKMPAGAEMSEVFGRRWQRTEQNIEEPGVEVAGTPGVLAHTDDRAGCCPSDGRGAGFEVGHERF